jgi:hypothetical protein
MDPGKSEVVILNFQNFWNYDKRNLKLWLFRIFPPGWISSIGILDYGSIRQTSVDNSLGGDYFIEENSGIW